MDEHGFAWPSDEPSPDIDPKIREVMGRLLSDRPAWRVTRDTYRLWALHLGQYSSAQLLAAADAFLAKDAGYPSVARMKALIDKPPAPAEWRMDEYEEPKREVFNLDVAEHLDWYRRWASWPPSNWRYYSVASQIHGRYAVPGESHRTTDRLEALREEYKKRTTCA